MKSINPDQYNPPFAFFLGVLNILTFVYFSKYETIETQVLSFLTLNIFAIGRGVVVVTYEKKMHSMRSLLFMKLKIHVGNVSQDTSVFCMLICGEVLFSLNS